MQADIWPSLLDLGPNGRGASVSPRSSTLPLFNGARDCIPHSTPWGGETCSPKRGGDLLVMAWARLPLCRGFHCVTAREDGVCYRTNMGFWSSFHDCLQMIYILYYIQYIYIICILYCIIYSLLYYILYYIVVLYYSK